MQNKNIISNDVQDNVERRVGHVLRIGVWVSAILMIAGLFITAIFPSSFNMPLISPTLGDLVTRLFSLKFDQVTVIYWGLILLMFTPILRVITALTGFTLEKDWRYMCISSVVLLMLAGEIVYSLFLKG
jgi:uncharacterized membrane protein